MKKSVLLYLVMALSVLVIVQIMLVFVSVKEMDGDAKVVNYAGLVRGATQRLVKLEIANKPNDELVAKLDGYLDALQGGENDIGITYMNDKKFQGILSELSTVWEMLKEKIYDYRKGDVSSDSVFVVSEEHFKLADSAVGAAEVCSQGKVSDTTALIFICSVTIMVIIVISWLSLLFIRKGEKEQERMLTEKNRQIAVANKSKSSFLSSVSHDIRTPLNGIIGMSSVAIANIENCEKVSDCLLNISRTSDELLLMLNDIIDISKIESGTLELVDEVFSYPNVIKVIMDSVKKLAEAKGQTFTYTQKDIKDIYIHGDHWRLCQIYNNVLLNAVKFTPEGGNIDVKLMQIASEKDGYARFLLVCSDNGIGISDEFLDRIFEPFAREKVQFSEGTTGSGLGLPISRSLTEIMGGKLRVESKKGVGTNVTIETEFMISLPSEIKELEEHPEMSFSDCDFSGRRILAAEDNEVNRQIVSEMLEGTHAELDFAHDGKECLDKFATSPENYYDLILMDVQMPVMTGTGATIAIRALKRPDAQTIPIIAMTANVFPEDIREVMSAGMDSHIAKPFDFGNVKSIMNMYMSKGRNNK